MSGPVDPERYIEVLQPDRCPLCFLLHDYIHEHLKSLLEESVTDPQSRETLFQSRGFCRRHAWQGVQQGKHLGMAILYGSLLERGLKKLSPQSSHWSRSKPKPCPLCESENKKDLSQVNQFALSWDQSNPLREAFAQNGILCLSHLERILSKKMGKIPRQILYENSKKALEQLLKDLNEFLEKQDYHRSHEAFGQERDAWIRAVRIISGERD